VDRLIELVWVIVESVKTMKTSNQAKAGGAFCRLIFPLILLAMLAQAARAGGLIPPGNYPPDPIASWSFQDTNFWTSDQGYNPISFTNIWWSNLGDGASLVVNAPGSPAYLNYYIYEPTNGATNLVLSPSGGSLDFWFAPNWSSGTNGGAGPGQWAQLIDVGERTPDSSAGYFGLSIDPSGSNIVFLSQDGAGNSYGLSAPISWMTNIFNFITLTYSSTNVSLYLNGQLATNDPGGLSVRPPPDEQAIWFGSDTNGNEQAQGLFNTVETYNVVLNTNDIEQIYSWDEPLYFLNPNDTAYAALSSAGSNPSTNSTDPDVITGAGELQANGPVSSHIYGANEYQVWITNVTATVISNGTTAISFTIEGGSDGAMYDVFATGALESPLSDAVWYWEGQGGHFTNYTIAITSPNAFLILGTPADSDSDGLTDAYELLVSHSNPNNPDTDGSGISDGWQVLLGLDPTMNQVAQPGTRSNYTYTPADWIEGISDIKSGSVTMDKEGNVTQVSE
jgi:hypothetical protein